MMNLLSNRKIGTIEKKEEEDFVVEWSIRDFFSLSCKCDTGYDSPRFFFADDFWYLAVYPNGQKNHKTEGWIGLYLHRKHYGSTIKMECSLGVKTNKENIDFERPMTVVFIKGEGYGITNLLSRTELSERKSDLLPSGTLTLVCRIKSPQLGKCSSDSSTAKCSHCKEVVDPNDLPSHEKKCMEKPIKCPECSDVIALKNWYEHECTASILKGVPSTAKCSHCKEVVDPKDLPSHEKKCMEKPIKCPECSDVIALKNWYEHECSERKLEGACKVSTSNADLPKIKILQDLKELYLRKEHCDVVFRVKDQEISAHKAILSVRSPVLASTFRHDMKEKTTGVVDIEDFDPCIFSDFLCFLYCEDLENLSEENVFGLFTAADKYDVTDLRGKCMEFIKANLSVDTFCDAIALALRHNETELIVLTTHFFITNADKIVETVKWQMFLEENPTHGNELFIILLAHNKISKK